MESIEQMIKRLCPEGVEYVKLGDCLEYEQPTKYQVSSKDYLDNGTPVLTAGQTFILGYTDETNGVYHASKEQPVIIFDDFTTSFHWVDFDFKVKSSAMKMLTPCNEEANFRFIYYAMKGIKYETLEHSRQWISTYSQFEIPLPPIEIQNRIVEVLDKMTTLTAELTAELEVRKQQYEYYRNKLLSFEEGKCEWRKLGEVCEIRRGVRVVKKQLSDSDGYPVYQNSLTSLGMYQSSNRKAGTTFVICAGAAGEIGYCNTEFWAADDCSTVESDVLNDRFIYFYLMTQQNKLKAQVRKASVPRLSRDAIESLSIPLPPMEIQSRIVSILDRFEALTTDLQSGLPAEIEARRQQYEYYRNKLLTFKPAV